MRVVLILILLSSILGAQERTITGTITFAAGPTVYAGLGSNQGLGDSCRAIIRSGKDTVAQLRLIATSSKSSSWTVERTSRDIVIGDVIVAQVASSTRMQSDAPSTDTTASRFAVQPGERPRQSVVQIPWLNAHGRVSFQYYGVETQNPGDAYAQPGVSVSLRSEFRDLPIRLDLYGAHRRSIRGSLSPWDPSSRPETRLYRLSLEYDDEIMMISAGRIYPLAAPTVSSLDGISVGRRFGRFFAGLAAGLEASMTLGRDPGNIRKAVIFAGHRMEQPFSMNSSLAYTRSYSGSTLVREAMSLSASAYTVSGFSLYGFGDVDLRRPLYGIGGLEPSLTSLMAMGSMRFNNSFSVFAGVDASRPVPSAVLYGVIPDSLIDRTLRSGITAGANVSMWNWNWNVSLSPRSGSQRFAKEYAATTSIGTFDLLSSGVDFRVTANLNMNAYTEYASYGLQVRKNVWIIDWRLRGQYSTTTILQRTHRLDGILAGMDVVVPLTRTLSLSSTIDLWRGSSMHMTVLFMECSWRF